MISYVNEALFRQNSIHKDWSIIGDGISLTNSDIFSEQITLKESICSESNIIYGSCESASLQFTTTDITDTFTGKSLHVIVYLNHDLEHPFEVGTFYVKEETLSADKTRKEIKAYDALFGVIDTNVWSWYDALTFPMTLKQFRDSFFNYIGILQNTVVLINDDISIEKTIDTNILSGIEVLKAICEVNGVLGHIKRDGTFEYKSLSSTSVYEVDASLYTNIDYAEYEVETIDRLQIRQESGDIGVTVGTGDNDYIVEDNFLLYGMDSDELGPIATALLAQIQGNTYIPCDISCIGNPCVEVGDRITVTKSNEASFETIVLQRTLGGLQALNDEIIAEGEEVYPDNVNGVNQEIIQLKGKSNVIEKNVEGTNQRITDVEAGLRTEIQTTAEGIYIQIDDLQSQLDGEIQYWERDGEPTLLNYPYWDFCTAFKCDGTKRCAPIYNDNMTEVEEGEEGVYPHHYYSKKDRQDHRNDICYDNTNNIGYKFTLQPGTEDTWSWIEIADTDYTLLMSRVHDLEITAGELRSDITEVSATVSSQGTTISTHTTQLSQTATQISSLVSTTSTQGSRLSTAESNIRQTSNDITAEVRRASEEEGNLSSRISANATDISARVTKEGGSNSSFGWHLLSDRFDLYSGNNLVFRCNSSGITINGNGTFNGSGSFSGNISASSGNIGGWSISGGAIQKADPSHGTKVVLQSDGTIVCYRASDNYPIWALQSDGGAQFHGNVTIDGYATASYVNTNFLKTQDISTISLSASQITSGTISADRIAGGSITGGKIAAQTISAGKLEISGGYFSFGGVNVLCPSTTQVRNLYLYDGTTYRQVYLSGGYVRYN